MNREKLYNVLDGDTEDNKLSIIYNYFMMATIVISLIPLGFKSNNLAFTILDKVTVTIFIVDYIIRFITADEKLNKGTLSFILYPITPMAIIDLLSILPSLTILSSGFRLLKMFRLLRTFRVFKAFKMFRYSKSISIIVEVIKKTKDSANIRRHLCRRLCFNCRACCFQC